MNTSIAPESSMQPALLTPERGGPLGRFWHLPSVVFARFTLRSYLRSGWGWGEFVFVVAFFLVFWTYPGTEDYFFSTGGVGLGILALLGTAIMVHRAMSARVYLPLARLTSRAACTRGLALASGVLRVPLYLLLLALALASHKIIAPQPAHILVGSLGLLANSILVSTLVVALSPPIATRLIRIVFLLWLVIALTPLPGVDWLATLLSVIRLPLLPAALCIGLGTTPNLSLASFWPLAVVALLIVGLALLADVLLKRRDLILH